MKYLQSHTINEEHWSHRYQPSPYKNIISGYRLKNNLDDYEKACDLIDKGEEPYIMKNGRLKPINYKLNNGKLTFPKLIHVLDDGDDVYFFSEKHFELIDGLGDAKDSTKSTLDDVYKGMVHHSAEKELKKFNEFADLLQKLSSNK